MIAGVLKETYPGESRVALVPAHIGSLKKKGFEIYVESGAGLDAGFTDAMYEAEGASVKDRKEVLSKSDVLLQVRALGTNSSSDSEDAGNLKNGAIVIAVKSGLFGGVGWHHQVQANAGTALQQRAEHVPAGERVRGEIGCDQEIEFHGACSVARPAAFLSSSSHCR